MNALTAASGRVRIIPGDCRETLAALPANSVECCVTSPPYFGLRDYGMPDQIGLEPTPAEFVAALVAVFREVRRVLRDDGTVWLNLGDSYSSTSATQSTPKALGGRFGGCGGVGRKEADTGERITVRRPEGWATGLKPKDLIGIPWRVAFALQDDGWYLRQDIIWAKPNPMPESVRDRCTKAHEYLFLLSKSPRYWFDQAAIAESAIHSGRIVKASGEGSKNADAGFGSDTKKGFTEHDTLVSETRNRRSVWTIPSQPYGGAHFATMPPALAEPCVLAGCPKGGTVLDPFGGAGTTGLVAARHGRNAILCELNPTYAALARDRIAAEWREAVKPETEADAGPLFGGALA